MGDYGVYQQILKYTGSRRNLKIVYKNRGTYFKGRLERISLKIVFVTKAQLIKKASQEWKNT